MSKLDGKKTYISLALVLLGAFGYGDLITEGELAEIVNLVTQLIGAVGAIYGRYDASRRSRAGKAV